MKVVYAKPRSGTARSLSVRDFHDGVDLRRLEGGEADMAWAMWNGYPPKDTTEIAAVIGVPEHLVFNTIRARREHALQRRFIGGTG